MTIEPFAQYGLLGLVLAAVGFGGWKFLSALLVVLREGFAKIESGMKEMGSSHQEAVKHMGVSHESTVQQVLAEQRQHRIMDREMLDKMALQMENQALHTQALALAFAARGMVVHAPEVERARLREQTDEG